MASGFLTKRILVTKEATPGVIGTSPALLEFLSESFDFKEAQASEEINLLGAGGDASPMSFGTSSYSGGIGLVASVDNMPFILTHIAGAAISTADATSDAYPVVATAVTVGDKFNHSDGKHTLTCTVAGTTDGIEPTLEANPNDDRNKKITDTAGVVFVAMPLLKTYSFERKQQMQSFTVEYEMENAAGETFFKRFSNVYMNSMPMGMTGSTISLKVGADFIGASSVDSTQDAWDENLALKAGAKIVPQFKGFYSYEDCTVSVDETPLCEVESINLDVSRNVTVEDAINGCKIVNIGIASAKGSMNRVFTIEDYNAFRDHTDFKVDFDFQKLNGCGAKISYPFVKPVLADPAQTIDKQAYLSTEISAYGTAAVQSFSAVITAPALVDETGAIIGAY